MDFHTRPYCYCLPRHAHTKADVQSEIVEEATAIKQKHFLNTPEVRSVVHFRRRKAHCGRAPERARERDRTAHISPR